ncbi:MAG: winged helix-turn-helix transcriptional regulator [Clostridia bacterium]|nr:winged helix-turn-helix transcriptional regulator [Clostridia bacterium]
MRLNEELGILFDMVCFGNTYFNREQIEMKYEKEEWPIELRMKAYQEIEAKLGAISSVLGLFFHSGESAESVVGVFANKAIASGDVGVEMFLSNFDDENQVLSMLVSAFFPDLDEKRKRRLSSRDLPLWYQVCEETAISYEIKMALLYLAASYETVCLQIRTELFRIYREVKAYHTAHRDAIVAVRDKFMNWDSVKQLAGQFQVDLSDVNEGALIVGVSLLNPAVTFMGETQNKVILICGSSYALPAKKEVKNIDIGIADFVVNCGSKQKVDILFLFREHGELTAAQLARLLGVSAPMAWRYVEMLRENKVLVVKRQEAKNIYYSLNSDYFYGVLHSVEEFVKCFDEKEK